MRNFTLILGISLLSLTACDTIYPPTPKPDYTIKVVKTKNGSVAVPPACPDWSSATTNPFDNQPLPQFGCANARNLAIMVDRPEDLVHGRPLGDSSGVLAVGAIRRYNNNQTRGLIDTDSSADSAAAITTAPTAASSMTGDVTGAAPAAAPTAATAP